MPESLAPPVAGADYRSHLQHVQQVFAGGLQAAGCDAVIIDAVRAHRYFLDDQDAPARLNPMFNYAAPLEAGSGSALLLRPGETPRLLWLQPRDYWHLPPADPDPHLSADLDVDVVTDEGAAAQVLRAWIRPGERTAWLGEDAQLQSNLGCVANPPALLHHVHWARASKTAWELANMRTATAIGVAGHLAAHACFVDGGSEFDAHCAYLQASRQTDADTPYANIVAFDEHAAVLHYQHRARRGGARHSFLIDAGGRCRGYASDITRTYARPSAARFAELIAHMDSLQQALVAHIQPGMNYVDLHQHAHLLLAQVLLAADLARGDVEALVAGGVTRAFLPHGLGHMLGIQTHDTGGLIADPQGTPAPPPPADPALRNTRTITPGQVFTIEPGLYFIPMLLDELRAGAAASLVNWGAVDALVPCGGIRIEDNIVVGADTVENMTRVAFRTAAADNTAAAT